MADLKISQLPSATTPLAGTEVLPIVQSSTTKQVSIVNLTAGRSVSVADATLTTGNLVIGTSGKGIDFSATGEAGGMTSELLNDYEEGTWNPVVNATVGVITSYTATGVYTKVGRLVVACCSITITNNGTGAGGILISGLPFSAVSSLGGAGRESATSGVAFSFNAASSTSIIVSNAAGAYPAITGSVFPVVIPYSI